MSDDWKDPLREIPHHITTAILIISMLLLDFAPVMVLVLLMELSERLVREKDWKLFETPLEAIMNHIEVFVLIAFLGVGAVKIFLQLGFSVWDMSKAKSKE